jgi:hypothetical protein
MILSTLPDLPGRTYDVIGVVFGSTQLWTPSPLGGKRGHLEDIFNSMIQQASRMGADAIVDIKMPAPGGDYAIAVAIGTAVKLR